MAITKKDIEKLSDVFATKVEMNARFEQVDRRFEQVDRRFERIDIKFEQVDQKIDLLDVKVNKMMESIDWLVGTVSKIRDDLVVRFSQYRRHDDQLENHEQRIKKIEEKALA